MSTYIFIMPHMKTCGTERFQESRKIADSLLGDIYWNTYIDGLVQDCSNSSVLATVLLQSCTKPSMRTC